MKTNQVRAQIAGHHFVLEPDIVVEALADVLPEPVKDHFTVVGGRRYPVKQVVSEVTGLDRSDFTTHQARRVLRRLGFATGRRSTTQPLPPPGGRDGWPHQGRQAEALRPHMGKWVATRGLEVLVAADTPQDVIRWLQRHEQRADSVFGVPRDPSETDLLATE